MKKTLKKTAAMLTALLMLVQFVPALAETFSSGVVRGTPTGFREALEIVASKGTYVLVGQTLVLDVNEGYNNVRWTSANEEIATIDENGLLTALAAGEVTITAEEGDYSVNTVVTVIDPKPLMEDVQAAQETVTQPEEKPADNQEPDETEPETQTPAQKKYAIIVINGESTRYVYDGEEHTLNTFVATSNQEFFDASKVRVVGEIGVSATDCGAYELVLAETDFAYDDPNVVASFVVNNGWMKITRAKVTVTANSLEKSAGDADPELTATVEGLIGEDTVSYTLERYAGETPGQYIIEVQAEKQQGNYSVATEDGKLTINKALREYPLYNIAQEGNTYYRLRKTTIKVDFDLDEYVSDLKTNGHAHVMNESQYQVEDYDFANDILTFKGKKYAHISRINDDLDVDGYYSVILKPGEEVTAVKKKIGAMSGNNPNWLVSEEYRYNDANAINSIHRNYKITFTDKAKIKTQFITQDLYSMLSINGNGNYYRLKKSTFSASKKASDLQHGTSLVAGEYIMTPYDFTNVVIMIDGVEYIYSKEAPDDEYVSYYTVEFERVIKEDRFNNNKNWYANDDGFLDDSKNDYANLPNETQAFHANYKATLHKGKDRPTRSVTIRSDWPEGKVAYPGAVITLTATLEGFGENVTLQWQHSTDCENWTDESGANGLSYTYILNETTAGYYWRVVADE